MKAEALRQKSFLSLLIYGARPKTLVAALFPVVLGMFIAKADGFYNIYIYLCTMLCGLFIQIGTNYANDYFDTKAGRDTKKRLGPARIGALGLLSKPTILACTITAFAIASCFAILLTQVAGQLILWMMALAIFLGLSYSMGKYSLANTGFANIVIFIVFGPLATAATYYLQTSFLSTKAAFLGIIPGCLSLMMFAMNNLRDIDEDRNGGKKTLVVRFGFDWGKKEFLRALFISWAIIPLAMMIYHTSIITLLPLILVPQGIKLGRKVQAAKNSEEIAPLFDVVAKYNAMYALFNAIAWRIVASL
ncbi:MAG: 1,4-dihydroxy-2-naphthoate octaprenyltransferase [Chlamydiia bacterium]|nr:1,4-dihydroxy-2-naphthoate octaprenyltransferase [Chlamydiia bacterium]